MSTPTNRQAEKERQPGAKSNPSASKSQGTSAKRTTTTPQSARNGQKPAQKEVTRVEPDTKVVIKPGEKTKVSPAPKPSDPSAARRDERLEQRRAEIQARQQERRRELPAVAPSAPKPATQPAAKATTPPAPKPRDPSVARRDERREQRRAEIQARQQDRRRELQQAKRQKLGIRYSFVVAAVLLLALVSFFNFAEHAFVVSLIAAGVIVIAEFVFLAVMTMTTPKRTSYRLRASAAASARLAPPRSDATINDSQEAGAPVQDAPAEASEQDTPASSD
ncbi:MAG TPA: hypothetical protein VF099_05045 [Ktedonobacterales bacterium]